MKTLGEKLFCLMEQIFFKIKNYAMDWCHHKKKKRFSKLASVKTACVGIFFSFFIKYYGQNTILKNNCALFNS